MASAAIAAVSALRMRGPRPTRRTNTARASASSSARAKPPSGPARIASGKLAPASAAAIGAPPPVSSATTSMRPAGQPARSSPSVAGAATSGTDSRSHCSAASVAMEASRSTFTRSIAVWRVNTGTSREAPSSVAFSTIASRRARLIGAKHSQGPSSAAGGRSAATGTATQEARESASMRAAHSPCAALNRPTASPARMRMTLRR